MLSLRRDWIERLEPDRRLRRAHRRRVHDDRADRGCALQACGGVDDVAGHHALASLGRAPRLDDGLSCGHRRPHGHVQPSVAQLLDRLQDPERRANGSLGVVLVGDRRTEDRHYRVTDELLDRSAEALDVGLDPLVVGAERCSDVLGVGAVGAIGEADEVDEEHRDDLPLLARRRGLRQRSSTRMAEAGALRVLLAARRADDHGRIFAVTRSGVYARRLGSSSDDGRRAERREDRFALDLRFDVA